MSVAAAGCNVSVVWKMLTPEKNDDWQVREGILGVSGSPQILGSMALKPRGTYLFI